MAVAKLRNIKFPGHDTTVVELIKYRRENLIECIHRLILVWRCENILEDGIISIVFPILKNGMSKL